MQQLKLLIVGTTIWFNAATQNANPAEFAREKLTETTKRNWEKVRSLEVAGEEFTSDEVGNDPSKGKFPRRKFLYKSAPGNRFFFRDVQISNDGSKRIISYFVEDGKFEYVVALDADKLGEPAFVRKNVQIDTSTNYKNNRNAFLSLWMPLGRPIHKLINDSTKIETLDDVVRLRTIENGLSLIVDLDVVHNFTPSYVEIVGSSSWKVLSFGESNGCFFPSSGLQTNVPHEIFNSGVFSDKYSFFRVESCSINKLVDNAQFEVKSIFGEVHVRDESKGSKTRKTQQRNGAGGQIIPFKSPAQENNTNIGGLLLLGLGICIISTVLLKRRSIASK